MCINRQPRLQQGERVRAEITSSKGQEDMTSSKEQEQEARRPISMQHGGARTKKASDGRGRQVARGTQKAGF